MANVSAGLRAVDLNLLPILKALLNEVSVTRASAMLGLSQPATSQALTRLRHLLGDPLLVKVGRTMRLTPRAERLQPEVESTCNAIASVLLNAEFRPEQTEREFIVSLPDFFALMLGPALMKRLSAEAPGICVRFIEVPSNLHDRLASGEIDVSVMLRIESLVQGLRIQSGYMDRLVGVAAVGHPLAARPGATLADYSAYPRLNISPDLESSAEIQKWRRKLGDSHRGVSLTASNMLLLPLIAARSDAYTVIPRALAQLAAEMVPLAIFDLPTDSQTELENCIIWSPHLESDPAHVWFRQVLDQAMRTHFDRIN